MDYYILCVFFVFLNIVYGIPSIKGLFCQDPDTGKLYPINSTWQSETFCGNYTCKLRKKNVTETEYLPLTKINVTKKDNFLDDNMSTSPSELSLAVLKKNDNDRQPVYYKESTNDVNEHSNELKNDDNDRYLTESEIKTITEVLRTVKKSDLEAIVEIYNLAQEIYSEMESTTEKMNKHTQISVIDEKENKLKNSKDSISYWYEPQNFHNKKVSPTDLKIEDTNVVPTTRGYPYPVPHLSRPFLEKDPMKVPYYYPMSQFQRMSSYMHKPYMQPPGTPKPCNKHNPMNYMPWYPQEPPKHPMPLLPYPFSHVHRYNFSYPTGFYYNNYPWAQLDIYNRQKMYPQPYGSYPKPAALTAEPAELKDIDDQNSIQEDINPEEEPLDVPEWQTEPLSTKVLNEVKANILEKTKLLKPLSLRKNLKFEKVGKVIKLDESKRPKRSIISKGEKAKDNKEDKFEAYIVRTTCETDIPTEPGYFRVGNVSQPYPACCPQRINS